MSQLYHASCLCNGCFQVLITERNLIGRTMNQIRKNLVSKFASHVQQFLLRNVLKRFCDKGNEAVKIELLQIHQRNFSSPVSVKYMTTSDRLRATEGLMFMSEK